MQDQGKSGHNGARSGGAGEFIPLTAIAPVRAPAPDLDAMRKRLEGQSGRQYWRSLEELADTDEFRVYLEREFPRQAPRDMQPLNRRDFVKLMGATLALAGLGGCAYQPAEKIVPYIVQPEELVPGKPLFYATAFPRGGYAYGVLGESHMGRPVKLEGNPEHPSSLGATDLFTQASILNLYDPERSQTVRRMGTHSTWDTFTGELGYNLRALRGRRGAGLRILTGAFTSPTLASQFRQLLAAFPEARIHQHEPAGRESVGAGARLAFGQDVHAVYHFDRATRILSLDCNFLQDEPGSVRYARDFMDKRRVHGDQKEMNRLYVVESTPTITGATADHRLRLRPTLIEEVARAIAAGLGAGGAAASTAAPEGVSAEWIAAVVADLREAGAGSLVLAGPQQPPVVHALAHAMNQTLGSVGKTVTLTAPVEVTFGNPATSLRELVDDMNAGRVETLLILSSNPAYTAPADIDFKQALTTFNSQPSALDPKRKKLSVHLGLYDDETGTLCQWHIPESHYLETWSDARAHDGTASIIQPLILPLYTSRSIHEVVAALLGDTSSTGYDLVRNYWMGTKPEFAPPRGARTAAAGGAAGGAAAGAGAAGAAGGGAAAAAGGAMAGGGAGGAGGGAGPGVGGSAQAEAISPAFERFWYQALHSGVIPETAAPATTATVRANVAAGPVGPAMPGGPTSGLEIIFRPDPTIWDGRYANNAWLQELPKPLTQLTWDNALFISPNTAQQVGLVNSVHAIGKLAQANGRIVDLTYKGRRLRAAVWVVPGHPDGAVTLTLGYGRTRAGKIGTGTGFNAYALRTSDAPGFGTGVEMRVTGDRYQLAGAQMHFRMEGRDLVREGTLEEYTSNPSAPGFMNTHPAIEEGEHTSLYTQEWPSDRHGTAHPQPEAGGTHAPAPGAHAPAPGAHGGGAPLGDTESGSAHPSATPGGQPPLHYLGKGRASGPIPGQEVAAWGMVIDLNACIGCNTCTIACQAENNIATVGKDQVANNREMHWLRVDNYYEGAPTDPETVFQPVACMHCEKAPCEPVCPVEATSHSAEGINEMTYNRCVGTRYCENNCPYKVRRFNFLQYADQQTPTIQMMRNPDVTVRSRGVMEKCTYCVQRVNEARMEAEKEERPIRDGDVKSACQQACPTGAIIFGNINDTESHGGKGSVVRQLKHESLNYTLLTDLNTRPRTSYLARLRNPNPALTHQTAGETGPKARH